MAEAATAAGTEPAPWATEAVAVRAQAMLDQISKSEFVVETQEDYKATTVSRFTTRTDQCLNTVVAIEEVYSPLPTAMGKQNSKLCPEVLLQD